MSRGAHVQVDQVTVTYPAGQHATVQHAVRSVSLEVAPGRIAVLLGPSGCGKTTLLRAIAGLERPSHGTITIGGAVVTGPDRWVPPERREVGMVFQDPALFPHLTVRENVEFGLRRLGNRATRERTARDALELVQLADLADRRPGTLSGGQQQRVALARSLAPRPRVMLLDEPFSALDAGLRAQLRSELASILREIDVTSIFVTHDQEEAFALGDEIALMRDGEIRQRGAPEDLYGAPADPWVARFVGEANLVAGAAHGDVAATALGELPLRATAHGPVLVLVRPEDVEVHPGGDAEVVAAEYFGHDVRYLVRTSDGAIVTVREHHRHRRPVGDRVTLRHRASPSVSWPAPPLGDAGPPGAHRAP